jgi:hypothetical protein
MMRLSQLGTSLKILSCAKSDSYFLFFIIVESVPCQVLVCLPRQVTVRILHHGNALSQREELLQLFDLGPFDTPCDWLCHWGNFWEVTHCRIMREWKWLSMNGCRCRNLIYAIMEFLSFCKGVVDKSNFLEIMLKNNDALVESVSNISYWND